MAAQGVTLLVLALVGTYDGAWRVQGDCSNRTATAARLDALLGEYRRDQRPEGDGQVALVVQLALNVRHASVDERAHSVRLIADLTLSWRDSRLSWNASEWECDAALVSAERLWLPDVELVSAARGVGGEVGRELRARLEPGRVLWARRLDLSAPVTLDLTDWPRDTQTTAFRFASRQYTTDEIDLAIMDMKYATVFESGGWEAAALSAGTVTAVRTADGTERRVAVWGLALRRRGVAGGSAARAALGAAGGLLVAAALQTPRRRAPLAAAGSLLACVWLVSASTLLGGAGGGGVPLVVRAAAATAVLGAVQCSCAAIVQRVSRRRTPPPQLLRRALANVVNVANVCDLTPDEPGDSGGGSGAWLAAAALLDRTLLAMGALSLALVYGMCL